MCLTKLFFLRSVLLRASPSRLLSYHRSVVRKHPFAFIAAASIFLILLALLVWQGSFSFPVRPTDTHETILLSAVSIIIFILLATLAFILFRDGIKLYIDRQNQREGSRIRSKLLFGAIALTVAPTLFSALFNYMVLNRTLDKWFALPARGIEMNLQDLDKSYRKEAQARVQAEADWLSLLPETREAALTGHIDAPFFKSICEQRGIRQVTLTPHRGVPLLLYLFKGPSPNPLQADSTVKSLTETVGHITVLSALTDDPSQEEALIERYMDDQKQLAGRKKFYHDNYFLLICLLTVFVLFFAAWSAQILSRQLSVPIAGLLAGAREVSRGNLSYRVRVGAIDELATLVRAFNEMTSELEGNAKELELRRRFTEAILESIPTGVISVSSDERIERGNRALAGIFSVEKVAASKRLADLFAPDDLADIRYLLKRARRTGTAACQLEMQRASDVLHLAVTAASLEEHRGFVMVIEDTSDLLRAQKASAWQEVARRIAHEIKNPLTPISLCADRIARQLLRLQLPPESRAILEECTVIIQQEVQTVKTLVDEFSQFSRFPAAQPVPADLNEIVESARNVFAGRLDGINLTISLDRNISQVMADRELLKRVIVNLIDNAAEAMTDSPVRKLEIATTQPSPDVLEISVTDTGCGVSRADKEKLFLPYFSTKARGTGLGLAIVSHIMREHQGHVRVEDNYPNGARFIVELNALQTADQPLYSEVAEANAHQRS
jgi:two-component system, NtrC family, nitrogen regulation sensor histidine kinase NtrY